MIGTVTTWLRAKGYGFILPDGSNTDEVFVHFTDLPAGVRNLAEGARISFEFGTFGCRRKAVNLRILDEDDGGAL